jgi:cyclic pyranopterin phosphate synthase
MQIDSHKLMYHVTEVSKWLNGQVVAPIYVEIGPISSCNHRCSFCALDYLKNQSNLINKEVLIKTLRNMADFGVKSIMFAGEGEPLLYPNLDEVIQNAKKFGLDVALTTNGVLFDDNKVKSMLKNLSWVKVSIDAGTKESYAKIHGCDAKDFLTLLENLRFMGNYKHKHNLPCKIGCQILLINENISEVEDLILEIKDLGLDYLVLKPYSQHPNSINKQKIKLDYAKLIELSKKYSKGDFKVIYRKQTVQELEENEIRYDTCYGINFFCLITAEGNIIPCNIFYNKEKFYYGNIYEKTFAEIWSGKQREKVKEKLYEKGCAECRKGCRLNFINKYLNIVKTKELEHINFI